MRRGFSKKRVDRTEKYIFCVLACGGIPFFFVHGVWGGLLQKAYLLTAFLLFVLVSSYWKSSNELWLWKAMTPVLVVHSGIVLGLAKLNLAFPQIDRLLRMTYGALTLLLGMEVLGFVRIIEVFRPEQE